MERIGAAVIGGGEAGWAVAFKLARAGLRGGFVLARTPRLGDAQSERHSRVVRAANDSPGLAASAASARRVREHLLW